MIHPLRKLAQHALPPTREQKGKPEETGPVDLVQLGASKKYREPQEAVRFQNAIDDQLGISAESRREKRELMAQAPHNFLRATPALFYHDIKTVYSEQAKLLSGAPTIPIVGDAHAVNAGTFRAPDGGTVWGLNDFDQADLGSPEWDLARMGSSLYVAARSGGKSSKASAKLVEEFAESYLRNLDQPGPSYLNAKEATGEVDDLIKRQDKVSQKEFLKDRVSKDGKRVIRDEKLVDPDPQRGVQITQALGQTFPELKILDLVSKPHSGGSTRGLERYYALIEDKDKDQPWLLEVKTVLPSPVQVADADLRRGDGEHVLEMQRRLGGFHNDERSRSFKLGDVAFFTREREREKGALTDRPRNLEDSAEHLGEVLARAHSSSGADLKGWVKGRKGKLIDNLVRFSKTYARQVESDFRAWREHSLQGDKS